MKRRILTTLLTMCMVLMLVRSAEEHPPLPDMIGTQTGFRMKTIIGMSVMSAQKRAMLEYIFGIMAL